MRFARKKDTGLSRVLKLLGGVTAAGMAYLAAREIPSLSRYLRILIAAKSRTGDSQVRPGRDNSEYAQGPRRASMSDEDRGHQRRGEGASAAKPHMRPEERAGARHVPSH
jgi:hypothetical protein